MADTVVFDTHTYVKKLEAVGFTEEQAEVHAETLSTLIHNELVTREYLDIRLKELELRLTVRLGAMMVAGIAIVAALVKLL